MPDFLLEIGCEEIPARMIDAASQELRDRVAALLGRERLAADQIVRFDSPRRLAVMALEMTDSQPDVTEQVNGPSVSVAFKDGQPTPAAHAFARKAGVDLAELEKITTAKGEYVSAKVTKKGRTASEILAENLPKEIAAIYWPKNMYWRKQNERFVRPVRWLVAMLDDETIPLEFDGVRAGKASRGHRMLSQGAVTIPRAGSAYVDALRAAKVLGRAEREQQIRKALDAATRTIPGARWREDKALLESVVNLTEFPSAILGSFDPQFLVLPEEVLVTVMRDHQKYFALEDSSGKLLPHFLAVLNTDGDPQGLIRHGNERVLRARFNDARFFWETDQKRSLLERLELLRHVTFQKDLGSYYEKTQRVQRLCSWLSEIVKQSGMAVRPGVIHKAVCLAKTDLTTELVKEFTELQGIVGGLYARVQELDRSLPEATRRAIADTIYDQYKPESAEDDVPRSIEGAVLSIGDKADTIAGMFSLGLVPTGSKDPFALRRQANGIVRIIAEKKLPLHLAALMRDARAGYKGSEAEKKFVDAGNFDESVRVFFRERLEFYLKDVCGYAYDVVKAGLAADADDVVDVLARAEAVKQVMHMPEFQAIGAACKRMRNILRQATEKSIAPAANFEYLPQAAEEEKSLMAYMERASEKVEEHRRKKEYLEALLLLSTAREPVDTFFDKVMVMVEDEKVRANRLALLRTLLTEFSTIADFSEIVSEGKG
ncbi:MAG TPA: glycine--tRNA ligase subunit beta [Candidatus Sulfotelmatobacter sp.]|jgi:glycyl-tRNA synthetase beta chain|nr:glycine--tRNA ligase subunit beta [Candidatus Sulfotelmatobacter sp.]